MGTVTIIGAAGAIGSSILVELYRQRLFETFILVDPRTNVLESYRIDLTEASVATGSEVLDIRILDPEEAADVDISSDLVIYAATKGEKPGLTRSSFAAANWGLLRSSLPLIETAANTKGLVLLVTNPIDVMATRLARESRVLDRNRILGYSLNDSTRLRFILAQELGIETSDVSAYALGKHGELLVPIFSDIKINGKHLDINTEQRRRILCWMEGWFDRWQQLGTDRSSTWSTAAGVALMVTAMREQKIIPTSIDTSSIDFLPAESFIALPSIISPDQVIPDPSFGSHLHSQEREKLIEAAEEVKTMSDELA
jgi:malate dehydrogenase